MTRYFIEVSYLGTNYAGFQRQDNAQTIQGVLESAIEMLMRSKVSLTGSSRTDAGVHALQNFFHFDFPVSIDEKIIYNLNAVLPADIAVKRLVAVEPSAHSRFDAISRQYAYFIGQQKDPFQFGRVYYFPYEMNFALLQNAATLLLRYTDFSSFSKRNTQVKSFICQLQESRWEQTGNGFIYHVRGNRFLRGMVRALTGTMLRVGRGRMTMDEFQEVIEARDCTKADFAVPAHGLYLERVDYPTGIL